MIDAYLDLRNILLSGRYVKCDPDVSEISSKAGAKDERE